MGKKKEKKVAVMETAQRLLPTHNPKMFSRGTVETASGVTPRATYQNLHFSRILSSKS